MICSKCGYIVRDSGTLFCGKCGTKLTEVGEHFANEAKKSKKMLRIAMICVICLAVAFLGLILVYYLSNAQSNDVELYRDIIDNFYNDSNVNPTNAKYSLYDIDGNGVNELLIQYHSERYGTRVLHIEIFAYFEDGPTNILPTRNIRVMLARNQDERNLELGIDRDGIIHVITTGPTFEHEMYRLNVEKMMIETIEVWDRRDGWDRGDGIITHSIKLLPGVEIPTDPSGYLTEPYGYDVPRFFVRPTTEEEYDQVLKSFRDRNIFPTLSWSSIPE